MGASGTDWVNWLFVVLADNGRTSKCQKCSPVTGVENGWTGC